MTQTGIPAEKLDRLIDRWTTIQTELNAGVNAQARVQLSKEFSDLDPIVAVIRDLRAAEKERADLEAMARDGSNKDMASLAEEELATLRPRITALEHELRVHLLPKDAADEKSAILEVRAGTTRIRAARLSLDWSPLRLLAGELRVGSLHAARLEIESEPSREPASELSSTVR